MRACLSECGKVLHLSHEIQTGIVVTKKPAVSTNVSITTLAIVCAVLGTMTAGTKPQAFSVVMRGAPMICKANNAVQLQAI